MILSAKDRKLLDEMLSDATPKVQERIDDYCDLVERLSAGPW